MAIAERRLAAEFNRPDHAHRRPPDLRHLLGRRPPGGHRLRGGQPGRPPRAWASSSSSTTTTTSSSTGRPSMAWDEDVLARFDAYDWHTQRVDDGNDLEAISAAHRRGPRGSAAQPHRRADPHRLRLAPQAGQPEGPRLAARRGRGPPDQGGLRLGSRTASSTCRTRPWPTSARRSRGRAAGRGAGTAGFDALRGGPPRLTPPSSGAASPAELPAGWDGDLPTYAAGRGPRHPPGVSQESIQALAAAPARAVRRRRRPLGEQPDRRQGRGRLRGRRARPQPALRRPRARHGRDRQRHRPTTAASCPYVRHVPELQRLHARRRSAWPPSPGCT